MGTFMGKAKFTSDSQKHKALLWKSFYIPTLLHAFFDFVLLSNTFLAFLIYPLIIYMMIVSLRDINESISISPFKPEEGEKPDD